MHEKGSKSAKIEYFGDLAMVKSQSKEPNPGSGCVPDAKNDQKWVKNIIFIGKIIENRTFGIWNKVPKRLKTQNRSKIHVLKQKSGLRILKNGFWLLNFRFWVSLNRKFNQILSNPWVHDPGSKKFGVDLIKIHDLKSWILIKSRKTNKFSKTNLGFF